MSRLAPPLLGVLLLASPLFAACAPAQRGEPFTPRVRPASAEAEAGERVFMRMCNECHPGGAAGLAPALNNKPLPAWMIRWQVRHGLGAMPAFGPEVIPDDELDALVTYLIELRRTPAPTG